FRRGQGEGQGAGRIGLAEEPCLLGIRWHVCPRTCHDFDKLATRACEESRPYCRRNKRRSVTGQSRAGGKVQTQAALSMIFRSNGLLAILCLLLCAGARAGVRADALETATTNDNTPRANARILSGTLLTEKNESVAGVSIVVRYPAGEQRAVTDAEGNFRFAV